MQRGIPKSPTVMPKKNYRHPANPEKSHKTDLYPVALKLSKSDKLFFTADTHFGEQKVLEMNSRPFHDVKEMDEELIRRWNETVPEDAVVFHLGDFGKCSYLRGHELIKTLHGRKYLVLGNHDRNTICRGHASMFEGVSQQMLLDVDGQEILLNHCPLLCYPDLSRSAWQLFGHVHSGPHNRNGYDLARLEHLLPFQYDVGVDNNDFKPVSLERIFMIMKSENRRQSRADRKNGRIIVTADIFPKRERKYNPLIEYLLSEESLFD